MPCTHMSLNDCFINAIGLGGSGSICLGGSARRGSAQRSCMQPFRSSPRIANKPCKMDGYPLAVQCSVTKCRHRLQCAAKPRSGGAGAGGGEVNKAVTSAAQTTLLRREQGASAAILFPLSPSQWYAITTGLIFTKTQKAPLRFNLEKLGLALDGLLSPPTPDYLIWRNGEAVSDSAGAVNLPEPHSRPTARPQ